MSMTEKFQEVTVMFNDKPFKVVGLMGVYNLNEIREQVVAYNRENPEPQICGSTKVRDMYQWTRNLEDYEKEFFGIKVLKGGVSRGATLGNEESVYAYAQWLNKKFGFAVIKTFKEAVHGNGEKAVEEAQKVAKTEVSAYRPDSIDHTKILSGIVNKYFGKYLTREMLRTIHNHANRKMFGLETEQLREKAREVTGSTAKKIAHRDLYEDFTTLRITSMMSSLSLRIKKMQGEAMSPNEVVQGIILAIDEIADAQGGAQAPEYLPESRIKKVNQGKNNG